MSNKGYLSTIKEKLVEIVKSADSSLNGNYTVFTFSIHVFALKSSTDQIQAKPAYELAYKIYKKLTLAKPDKESGLLEIYNL